MYERAGGAEPGRVCVPWRCLFRALLWADCGRIFVLPLLLLVLPLYWRAFVLLLASLSGDADKGNSAAARSLLIEALCAALDRTGELEVVIATRRLRALDSSLRVLRTLTEINF